MNKTLLLMGGGIDSTALLAYLSSRGWLIEGVFFRYGQKAEAFELEACRRFCKIYNVGLHSLEIPLSHISSSAILDGGAPATDASVNIMEGRNAVFITLAAMLAAKVNADSIALGFHREPIERPFPDATPEFVEAMNDTLRWGLKHGVRVVTPFSRWTRKEIFKWCLNLDPSIIQEAHTCYEAVEGGCGQCSHCLLKTQLLTELATGDLA